MEKLEPLGLTHETMNKISYARTLRRKMTDSEKVLWEALRNRQCDKAKFRRQVPLGHFVADFCCMKVKLIIEIDGGVHHKQHEYDAERENLLIKAGFHFLRFRNEEVMNDLPEVLQKIQKILAEK